MAEVGPVRLFTLSTCGHCKAAKAFLRDHAVSYDLTDVDLLEGEARSRAVEELRKYNPRLTFPTIIIGDRVIVGNNEPEIRKALGL